MIIQTTPSMSKLGESSSSVVNNTPPHSNNVNAEHSLDTTATILQMTQRLDFDDIADFADADPIHYVSTKKWRQ